LSNILDHVPKPLLSDIVSGSCIPIIGAGFSQNAIISSGKNMPNWEELGRKFVKLIPNYTYSTPIDAISTYCYEFSRVKLIEELIKILSINKAQPGPPHRAFCELPFDIVCTTNFDFLIEKAYDIKSQYCRPVISDEQLSIANSSEEVILVKLHGDLHHPDRLVATEDDYDNFIERNPVLSTYLGNLLITRTPLFIGYSLDDPDFRQIWQVIGERLGKMRRPAYVLTVGIDALQEKRYERRGVKVVNLPGKISNYGQILETFFENLRLYWPSNVIENSNFTDEESWGELSLPKESANRLVYFAIPFTLHSFYTSFVFPIVESFGLVPITLHGVITPRDNIKAKVLALIDRSQIVIADVSTQVALAEIGMALSRKPNPPKIILIKEENYELPSGINDMPSISRPVDLTSTPDDFLSTFEDLFQTLTEDLRIQIAEEPQRLLVKKEYRAAVISAITLLEITLQKEITINILYSNSRRPPTLPQMLNNALKNELLNKKDEEILIDGIKNRNRLVHTDYSIKSSKALQIVNDVMRIIDSIKTRKK